MNLYKKLVTGSAALLLAGAANISTAALISMDPDPVLANIGDSVLIDLVWDGTDGTYLGAWDVDMSFDSTILSFVDAVLDPDDGLGDDASFATDFGGGLVNMFSLSLVVDPDELRATQDGLGNVFNLATIEFTAIGAGDVDVMLTGITFSDAEGGELTPTLIGTQVCVDPAGTDPACGGDTPMPEPGILSLFGLSLLGLAFARRRPAL